MKIITTQIELNNLKEVSKDEEVYINVELRLNHILKVFGKLFINANLDCNYYSNRYVKAWGSATVEAWGSATVKACDSATVEACDSATVEAWGSATVEACDSATVKACDSATVKAWGSATVEACDSATVEACDSATVRITSIIKELVLSGFSVLIKDVSIKMKFKRTKNVLVQNIKYMPYFEREGITAKNGKVILYKKVSFDYKTQEGTSNETLWAVGSIVEHKAWNPSTQECGAGKFHACSRTFFCDEFRNNPKDRYVAIEVFVKDCFEWKDNPDYPHKIAFRKCKVLYECDSIGRKVTK